MTALVRPTWRGVLAVGLIYFCVPLRSARSEEPSPAPVAAPADAAPAEAPAPVEQAAKPSTPAPNGASLDFDFFADGNKPKVVAPGRDPVMVERQVKRRRQLLQLHQGFGFATLAALAATLVIGQLNYIDKYGGGNFTERYQTPHLGLALGSSALFATTGLLALFAPTPYKKPHRADAAMLHKVMMVIATAGMATQLALGFATAAKGGELQQRDLALTHMVTGYVTFAAMTAGYLAYVF